MEEKFSQNLKNTTISADDLGSFKIVHSDTVDITAKNSKDKVSSEYKIVGYETRPSNRHKNPSGVWKYFALATKESATASIDEHPDDRILCMICYSRGRVHVYKSKTSSSNLWKHLNRKHNIEIPSEKMFTITTSKYDGFEFGGDAENSIDDQLSAIDPDDHEAIVIKPDDYDEADEFQEEQIIATSIEEEAQIKNIKYKVEAFSTEAEFKDIGSAIIEEVSKRPILYENHSSKWPAKKITKEVLWTEVYHALGEIIQIDRIQKIWKDIRDRYRKIRTAEKDGTDSCNPKYRYYHQLRFLDEVMDPVEPSDTSLDEPPVKKIRSEDYSFLIEQNDAMLSNVDDLVRSEQSYISEEMVNDNNCGVSSSNPPNDTTAFPLEISIEDYPNKQCLPPVATNNADQMDEFDLFGKLIANKLRNVPKDRVDLIEIKIMQTILENS